MKYPIDTYAIIFLPFALFIIGFSISLLLPIESKVSELRKIKHEKEVKSTLQPSAGEVSESVP